MYIYEIKDSIHVSQGFIEDPSNLPDIWAHEQLPLEIRKFHTTAYGAKFKKYLSYQIYLHVVYRLSTFVKYHLFQN